MSATTTYTCDICGTERKQANHWFLGKITAAGVHLWRWAWGVENEKLDDSDTRHLCGQACAHKLIDQFLSGEVGR